MLSQSDIILHHKLVKGRFGLHAIVCLLLVQLCSSWEKAQVQGGKLGEHGTGRHSLGVKPGMAVEGGLAHGENKGGSG